MVGIVILNYNTWDATVECVESIFNQNVETPYMIYLVDNASSVKMPESCRRLMERNSVIFIQAEENRGYSAGNNLGIKKAVYDGCDMVLISNNDVVFLQGTIDILYTYLLRNPGIGLVGPKVLKPDGKMQETNLGCKMTLCGKYLYILRKTPFWKVSENFVKQFRIREEELIGARKVFGVSGCCFMIRKEVLDKIGLLDENTFLYEEENILGCQMEKIGYEVYLLPEAKVIHKHGQSTKYQKAFSFICLSESEIYYCRKYLGASVLKMLPLYMIRVLKYLWMCLKDRDYRKNIDKFFHTTILKI